MRLKNVVKHFMLVTHHKWVVFKLCCKIGIPWRGLVHDLSKYSPTEFWESAKYYVGTHSPIKEARKHQGYSRAWLHHKGRNKHHIEYWVDEALPERNLMMPYKYAAEMVCDKLAASIIYQGKKWTKEFELSYWENERDKIQINPKLKDFITAVMTEVAQNGVNETYTKENIKRLYKKYCES